MTNKSLHYSLINLLVVRPTKFESVSFLQNFLKDRFFSVVGEHVDLCHFYTPAKLLFYREKKKPNFLNNMRYPDDFLTKIRKVPKSLDLDDRSGDIICSMYDARCIPDESIYSTSEERSSSPSLLSSSGDSVSSMSDDDRSLSSSGDSDCSISDDERSMSSSGDGDCSMCYNDIRPSSSGGKKRKPFELLGAEEKKRRFDEFKKDDPQFYSYIVMKILEAEEKNGIEELAVQ